ncbi:MAG: carotenoid oxygenase family protein [Pirellulales bacterium]
MTSIRRRDFLLGSAGAAALFSSGHLAIAAEEQSKWPDIPFLQGPFAPVHEEITADDLKIIGRLPADLDGMFVRNGPNLQFPPKQNYHLFEGDGMVHGVRLRDGKASYRNRWVRTAVWKEENAAGQSLYSSILDPLDFKLVAKQLLEGKFPFPNRANTALIWHHGKLLALWEAGPPHEIKIPGLETIGEYNFGGKLKHAFTAHPKIDTKTGELMFHAYSPFPPYLQYSVADREGKIVRTTPIDMPRPVMMHDLAITEHYTLFLDTPLVLNIAGALRGELPFKWEPKFGARIGVLPRHAAGDKIRWFEINPCFVFHVFNAFEDGDVVNLYGCRFPEFPKFVDLNAPVAKGKFEDTTNSSDPIAYRWRLDLKTGEATETSLDDVSCEFPRVDDRRAGVKTRYGYAASGGALVKFDFDRETTERHDFGKGGLAGEGVFVPQRDGKNEDDGYLIAFVYNQAEQRSELTIVDCREFKQAVVARILIPQRVPFGFHGMWLDGQVL